MLRLVTAFAIGAVASAPAIASAHDLWLLPPTQAPVPGYPVQIEVTQGMTFPGDDVAPNVANLARVWAIGPDGKTVPVKRRAAKGNAGIIELVPKTRGVYTVAVDTKPKLIDLDAADFNHYLVADGMPHVYKTRHDAKQLGKNAKEQYAKTVKLVFMVGDVVETSAITGQRLEIVPLDDPFGLTQGDTLRVRVLMHKRPLADARLGYTRPGNGDEPIGTVRTNEKGEALIPIHGPGPMTIRLTHMEHPKTKDYEWRSSWTTLTFAIPSNPTKARVFAEAKKRLDVVHGGPGPFAMAGYRIGTDAMRRLGEVRGSTRLRVRHASPDSVQWSCVADGVQAATGASPGKLNLERVSTKKGTFTEITVREHGRVLRYELAPSFVKRYLNQPRKDAPKNAAEIAGLPNDRIFILREQNL